MDYVKSVDKLLSKIKIKQAERKTNVYVWIISSLSRYSINKPKYISFKYLFSWIRGCWMDLAGFCLKQYLLTLDIPLFFKFIYYLVKNILFVCTGNSARSIIAESLVNNRYNDKFKAYSAGSNPSGEINKDIKHFLNNKGFNLQNYSSKNFNVFVNGEIKIDHVITVCNNANNEVCPIWPKENQIIHWDIEDPVTKLNDASEDKKFKIITDTFNNIDKRIKNWILNEKY